MFLLIVIYSYRFIITINETVNTILVQCNFQRLCQNEILPVIRYL